MQTALKKEETPRQLPKPDDSKAAWRGWVEIIRPGLGTFPSLWMAPDGQFVIERRRTVFPIGLRESIRYVRWLHGSNIEYDHTHLDAWLSAIESKVPGRSRGIGQILDRVLESSLEGTEAQP